MSCSKLHKIICDKVYKYYEKYAGSQEFLKLRDDPKAKLWISRQMAEQYNAKEFAIFDKKIQSLEQEYGFEPRSYLNDSETKKLIKFILDKYDFYFKYKNISGYNVYSRLIDELEYTDNPIFLLMHDLIHQVLSVNFIEELENEKELDDQGLYPGLSNELNEDIASYLSNIVFNKPNQGLFRYIKTHIANYLKELNNRNIIHDLSDARTNLSDAINFAFHRAKAELRGKTNKFEDMEKSKISSSKKQLIDGFLSKIKVELLSQVENFSLNEIKNINLDKFWLDDLLEEYYDKINKSEVVGQTDGAALTAWMRECLAKMHNLVKYFENCLDEQYEEDTNNEEIDQAIDSNYTKNKPGIAIKSNPTLWSRCKSEAKARMGGKHSARAMQLALKLYKQRGGKFKGKKPTAKNNKMKKWTKQKWMYLSDYNKKNKADDNDATGRYLPEDKWKALSPEERKATDKKKKEEGKNKQYVPNTEKAKVHSDKKYY